MRRRGAASSDAFVLSSHTWTWRLLAARTCVSSEQSGTLAASHMEKHVDTQGRSLRPDHDGQGCSRVRLRRSATIAAPGAFESLARFDCRSYV